MINLQAYEGHEDGGSRAMTFPFEGHSVRVMDRDGEPWWFLADVCAALDIAKPENVAARLDDDEKATTRIEGGGNLNPNRTIINQSGLFSLVLTSRKPDAKRFKKWVTAEVLPAIRKTGGYMVAAPDETPEALALRALTVLQDTVERQKAQLAISEPKAAGFDQITAGNYLPSIRKFFSVFDGVNLIAVPARLVELGYLYRDPQDNYRVRRERPRALELFREHIQQNSAWTSVTISLRAAGQEEMAELYRQGQIPLLKAFQQRLQ
ncbi:MULTISPECIES: BRO family protein [unclassified Asaia]|uniref:BRO-N domain-containing protein n=1 Tax=unclassified Asaia TaxID=2685023 RepID=UPI001F3BCE93|nr:BRO family protein [Asaia sp. W19]